MDASDHTEADDQAWHTHVTLEITPDNRLTPDQQEVIAHDYGMTNGQLKLTVRAKLAPYLLQLLNLNVGKQLEDASRSANCAGKLRRDKPVAHLTIPIQHVVL